MNFYKLFYYRNLVLFERHISPNIGRDDALPYVDRKVILFYLPNKYSYDKSLLGKKKRHILSM